MYFNEVYPESVTSASAAANVGNLEVLKHLLENGKATNLQDNRGWRALHHATSNGHIECVKILIEANVDLNAITFERETALFIAVSTHNIGDEEKRLLLVQTLLNAGADPKVEMKRRHTHILNAAISKKQLPLVKILLDSGVDVNEKDDGHGSSLDVASYEGCHDVVDLLLRQKLKLVCSPSFHYAFFHNCLSQSSTDIAMLKKFLKKPECLALINEFDSMNQTALLLATRTSEEAAHLLLDYGADPNIRDSHGFLPIFYEILNFGDDVSSENSLFMRLFQLTCKSELKQSDKCIKMSVFHACVIFPTKKNILKFLLKQKTLLPAHSHKVHIFFSMDRWVDDHLDRMFGESSMVISPISLWCANLEVEEKDLEVLQWLITDAAENLDSENGIKAIIAAVARETTLTDQSSSQYEVIHKLMKQNVDLTSTVIEYGVDLGTAYLSAILQESPRCFRFLLKEGPPPNHAFKNAEEVVDSFCKTIRDLVTTGKYRFIRRFADEGTFGLRCISWVRYSIQSGWKTPKNVRKLLSYIFYLESDKAKRNNDESDIEYSDFCDDTDLDDFTDSYSDTEEAKKRKEKVKDEKNDEIEQSWLEKRERMLSIIHKLSEPFQVTFLATLMAIENPQPLQRLCVFALRSHVFQINDSPTCLGDCVREVASKLKLPNILEKQLLLNDD